MNRNFSRSVQSLLGAAALASAASAQASIFVPAQQPTIQAGINAAVDGDTVWVAPGTYFEHDLDFGGRNIAVRAPGGAATTIIDAQSLGRGFHFHSGEGPGAVLAGFTIQNGQAPDGADPTEGGLFGDPPPTNATAGKSGGGILIDGASPVIRDCVLVNNRAGSGGSGLFFGLSQSVGADGGHGGGVAVVEGVPAFERCSFVGNQAGDGGSGHQYDPFTACCSLNGANGGNGGSGGGLSLESSAAGSIAVRSCVFFDNAAGNGGQGGTSNATSGLLPGGAGGHGGAVYGNTGPSTTAMFENVTSASNAAGAGGAGGQAGTQGGVGPPGQPGAGGGIFRAGGGGSMLRNSIVRSNAPDQLAGVAPVDYSNVQGTPVSGVGNVDVDPLFVDPVGGDLRLSAGSPSIDAGDSSAFGSTGLTASSPSFSVSTGGTIDFSFSSEILVADLDGNLRRFDDPLTADTGVGSPPPIDMGAYEFGASSASMGPLTYWMFGSFSGTSPGTPLNGLVLPLNIDAYFNQCASMANQNGLVNTLGVLGPDGTASSQVVFPPVNPNFIGRTGHHAMTLVNPIFATVVEVSAAVQFEFVP